MVRHVLLASLVIGCAVEQPVALDEVEQTLDSPGGTGGCPVWGCGSNSPVVDAIASPDLNTAGLPNSAGFRITGFQKLHLGAWRNYRAAVVDGELLARNLATNAVVLSGTQLVGARFVLHNKATKRTYYLAVTEVGSANMWAQRPSSLGHLSSTPTYHLRWQHQDDPPTAPTWAVCGERADYDGIDDLHAVLFERERIDADALRVADDSADWFNIGCAGHALAKQHLTGHTHAGAAIVGVSSPTPAERTANLKMITGDYCGRGDPFTVAGQPLRWRDENNWFDSVTNGTLEARWTENGASCLNTPRVEANHTPQGDAAFPDGVEDLLQPDAGWCTAENPRPPPCTGTYADMRGAHVLSVNPGLINWP